MATVPVQQNPNAMPEPPNGHGATRPVEPPRPAETRTIDWSDDIGKRRMSAWRVPVGEHLQWLQADLDDRDGPPPTGVLAAMRIAYRSARARSNLATWYSGANIERCWRALHLAEARVSSSSPDLAGRLPGLRERVLAELDPKDQRVRALLTIKGADLGRTERAVVAEALRAAYSASDNSHTAVRGLRNRLVLFGLLILGLNLTLGILSSRHPHLLPLCIKDFCAMGPTPTGGDVWLIQLVGAFGGAVAVMLLLLRTKPSVVAYTLTPYQACIKIMLGAVLAIIGILIAATGVLQGVVTTRPALLVLALIFGYSQQVGTRLLDSYADDVVGRAQPKLAEE
ncbi:MAG: hypothetical protein ACJ72N_03965 [Labedaea sp.]